MTASTTKAFFPFMAVSSLSPLIAGQRLAGRVIIPDRQLANHAISEEAMSIATTKTAIIT
jgi:hypothetical protein